LTSLFLEMDFDSSSKFIASLAKFLQSLCNGYVDFDKGVEVIGHIYINVDSDTGKKVDYVLNEKVCKNDNSITFISNSFHAQPAEKPKPLPKKIPESEKQNEDTIVMEDSGPTVPNSTNVGTMGSFRNTPRGGTQDITFTPGSKRPRTPPLRRNLSSGKSGSPASKHMSPSTRYQDSGGPSTKISRSDIPPSPLNNSGVGSEDYDNPNVFQSGGEEDDSQNYSSNFLEQNSSDLDQKPVIDPDISIVKEEYMSSQQNSCAYAGANQSSGSAPRGKHQQTAYPVMMHPNSSNYSGVTAAASHQSDSYSSASLEGAGDPS
ncbi:glutenin, high molecular weight subunit PW212 isoform X32, partial [Biomphalaria glabrata]